MITWGKWKVGQILTWSPSAKRAERLKVRIVDFTEKRIVVIIISPGWDHSKKYYLQESWLLP